LAESLRITVEAKDEAVEQAIQLGLRTFNRTLANWPQRQHFNVVLRDTEGRLYAELPYNNGVYTLYSLKKSLCV
jgi:hypothetical protein